MACFAAALLAKEEVAAFPLLLLWLDHKRDRSTNRDHVALSLAAGLRVIYALAVTPDAPAGMQAGITPWHYFLAQGAVVWRYLRLLVLPFGFTVDPEIAVPAVVVGLAGWAALLLTPMVSALGKVRYWLTAGVVLLLPSSSIFPAADLAADRRMYLPMFAFAVAIALLLERVNWRWAVVAVFAAISVRPHSGVDVGRAVVARSGRSGSGQSAPQDPTVAQRATR